LPIHDASAAVLFNASGHGEGDRERGMLLAEMGARGLLRSSLRVASKAGETKRGR
jgi:hypothetical protein